MKLKKERGVIRKKWRGRFPIALVFPHSYHVGMSNLGFRWVYHFLNSYEDIVCERFFLPSPGESLRSIESNRPLTDFPVVLFSISFEADFPNVVKILSLAGLPLLYYQRQKGPVILAGGVATWLNPDPLAPFVDGFLLGEIEAIGENLCECILSGSERNFLLTKLKDLPGFLPSSYELIFSSSYCIKDFTDVSFPIKILKAKASSFPPPFSDLLTPDTEFSSSYLLEVRRGCGQGCRFCAAGMLYRPPRSSDKRSLKEILSQLPPKSKVGLVGLEFLEQELLSTLFSSLKEKDCILSFSSLRIDALTPALVQLLKKQKTATVAPEAGSERLRRVINKRLSEEDIQRGIFLLVKSGIKIIKLYFMIGLPTEEDKDIEEIVTLVKKIKKIADAFTRSQGYLVQFKISIANFIPKPWTPFQWVPMEKVEILKKRLNWLKSQLRKIPNVQVSYDSPKRALGQALLARGDRRLKDLILLLAQGKSFSQALKALPLEPDFWVYRLREKGELFPWDILSPGLKKEFLWQEWQKALRGEISPPCLLGRCKRCGAC